MQLAADESVLRARKGKRRLSNGNLLPPLSQTERPASKANFPSSPRQQQRKNNEPEELSLQEPQILRSDRSLIAMKPMPFMHFFSLLPLQEAPSLRAHRRWCPGLQACRL